jgi:hypothetical protein
MAEVCGQLSEMVELVDDFFKFLGPELKAVTGGHSLPAQYNYPAFALAERCHYSHHHHLSHPPVRKVAYTVHC